jgi:hypothetical protein
VSAIAPRGQLFIALCFKITDGRIVEIDVVATPSGLACSI